MIDKNNIPQGYKNSVVGIIPEEWEVKRLGEVCHDNGKYGINAPAVPYEDKLPTYLRITDIDSNGNFIKEDKMSVDNPCSSQFVLKEGDIVFARTGATVGKTYLYKTSDGELVYAGFLICFSLNENEVVPYYIKAYTETSMYNKWVRVISQRSGQPGINSFEYGSLGLPIPPLAEQKKIAEILCTWDDAIEKQSKLIEKLELRKRGLMQRLLTGKTRLPGFTEPWKKIKLGEIGSTYMGLSGKTKSDFENGNAKFISYVNVFSNEKVNINDFGTVKVNSNEKQNIVRYGDIFFTVSSETPNEVGMSSVLLDAVENTYLNSFCFGYRLNDFSVLEPVFASYILRTDKFRSSIILLAQGSTRFNLSKNEVMKLQIELPLLAEQNAIAAVLTSADKEIETQRKKIEALRQQKRGLMQQLLTGKIRVRI